MDDGKALASSQISFPSQRFCGIHFGAYFSLNNIMVRLLEEKDPDNRNGFGRTPLSYATGNGNAQLVELLLGYNVDINSKCDGGMTPLSRAIEGEVSRFYRSYLPEE
jgi:hypothetical protein